MNKKSDSFVFNRIFISFALMVFSACLSAKSIVTVHGVLDATYILGKGSLTDKTQLGNSSLNTSRSGFRGIEELGAGFKSGFVLEMGMSNDDGTGAATKPNNQGRYNFATVMFAVKSAGEGGVIFN